jgi:putative FmdB family regulatory protein
MPTYEYECGSCRYRFDLKQGFDDEPVATCPQCEQRARRVFHPAPVIYKTSGFYITDSRQKNNPAPAVGKSGSEKSGSEKSEATSSSEGK